MVQEQKQRQQTVHTEEVTTASVVQDQEAKAKLDADIDAILDEIDAVLEPNAQEFVRGYVQEGGE